MSLCSLKLNVLNIHYGTLNRIVWILAPTCTYFSMMQKVRQILILTLSIAELYSVSKAL